MSPVNVGLLGHNGLVGGNTLKELAALQKAGKAKLVVIHRPSASTETIPSDVEARSLDLTKPDGPDFDAAVAGLDVVV
jgi:nucleoside-diphosphate-sugar epimerase